MGGEPADAASKPKARKPNRQAFSGWRNTGAGDRPWNSGQPKQ